MSRRVVAAVVAVLTLAAGVAMAQEKKVRWSVSGGPSGAQGPSGYVPQNGSNSNFTWSDPIISGANDGRFNLGVGASRPLSGSLKWRLDLMYNLATSGPRPDYTPCDPNNPPTGPFERCGGPRPALRDELVLGTIGLQWDAFPSARWSPYLLTTVGFALSRLQWSRDHTATQPDETTFSRGLAYGYGLGMRFPLLGREAFVESRRHRTTHVYSSKFVPLSFGIRF
jgi:hypothetical protein